MKFEDIFKIVDPILGWSPWEDLEAVYTHASKVKGTIVEIGAFMGRMSKTACLASPKSIVYSIEPFGDHEIAGRVRYADETYAECIKNLKDCKNWVLIRDRSENVKWDKPIDLLIVDGDHKEESVEQDIRNYVPFVNKGSFVLFHDYHNFDNEYTKGVRPAVDRAASMFNMTDYIASNKKRSAFKICQK